MKFQIEGRGRSLSRLELRMCVGILPRPSALPIPLTLLCFSFLCSIGYFPILYNSCICYIYHLSSPPLSISYVNFSFPTIPTYPLNDLSFQGYEVHRGRDAYLLFIHIFQAPRTWWTFNKYLLKDVGLYTFKKYWDQLERFYFFTC